MRARRTLLVVLATLGLFAGVMPAAHADTTATDTYIVELKSTVSASAVAPSLLPANAKVLGNVHAAIAQLTAAKAASLASNPNVVSVRKDIMIKASGQETNAPWDLDLLDSRAGATDNAYNYPNTGTGVTVYVVDSGLIPTHSEFASATILPGRNFVPNVIPKYVSGTTVVDHYCGPGTVADPTVDPANTVDQLGHGTAVSSLVVGARDGVAKGAKIVPVRILDCDGEAPGDYYVSAVNWILADHLPGTPAVVNVSLGGPGDVLNTYTQQLITAGITVVVAAGNENVDACSVTPASTPGAITAAAVTPSLTEPVWPDGQSTNYGSCVDLYAPGDQVVAADWKNLSGGNVIAKGTSFSSPLTAGAAAQVLADHPTWKPDQVSADLSSRATYGVVNGARSVNRLVNVAPMPAPGLVIPLPPVRLIDTRGGTGLVRDQTVTIPVRGIQGVSKTASSVLVNITCTEATAGGYITGHASGSATPFVSSANFAPGKNSANLGLVPVGDDGAIALTVGIQPGAHVQLVVDLQGYVAGGGAVTEAGAVVPVAPARLVDTRQSVAVQPYATLDVQVTGANNVPVDAAAVFINVTVTEPAGTGGYLTVYPKGQLRPLASNLNFVPNQTIPNLVVAKVGDGGYVSIFNYNSGASHLVVDVQGYVTAGAATAAGAVVPVTPARVLDTRSGVGTVAGAVPSGAERVVTFTGQGGISAASGVFMNLTVTEPAGSGYLSAYPASRGRPLVSNLNFDVGDTVPNLVSVGLTNGQATLYNGPPGSGSVHMVADVMAYIL